MPRSYVDDNFGHYEIESQDDVDFYHEVQRKSVWKKCDGCGKKVKIMPHYGYCNTCATARENGWDLEY
jgi:hypothetical protein